MNKAHNFLVQLLIVKPLLPMAFRFSISAYALYH